MSCSGAPNPCESSGRTSHGNDRLAILEPHERELVEKLVDGLRSELKPADMKGSLTANVHSFWEFLPAGQKTVQKKEVGNLIRVEF
jgi:hypothetical protein